METGQLRYFVAAAECGSISRAARRCGVAQPTLSQQVGRLEHQLGVALFDRVGGRGVAITDAGRALLPRARRILAELQDAEAALTSGSLAEDGRLALGAIPTMAPYLLPPLVAALHREYPRAELLVREDLTENLVESLVDHVIDAAIVSTPLDHPLVELEVLGREPMVVVVPHVHPLHRAGDVSMTDLRDEPAVTLHEMHCLGRQIDAFCAQRRISRQVTCRTTQLTTVLELVRRGVGISIVPAMAASHDSGRGLVFLPMKRGAPEREIALAWRAGRSRPALGVRAAERLVEFVHRA